jgi:hypothetical protein
MTILAGYERLDWKERLLLTSRQSLLDDLNQISRAENGFCRVSHQI